VLRRIIRRAIRHGYKLGQTTAVFPKLVPDSTRRWAMLSRASLRKKPGFRGIEAEEERFAETLENGMAVLEIGARFRGELLDGETAFRLYDPSASGRPHRRICRERGVMLDMAGFEAAMDQQRERARAASKFAMGADLEYSGGKTEFRGYDTAEAAARVVALYKERHRGAALKAGEAAWWCSTRRRSTPSRAARSATRRDRRLGRHASRSPTRRRSGRRSSPPRQPQDRRAQVGDRVEARVGHRAAPSAPCATIGDASDATRRCARCSGRTCSRRARWWTRTRRAFDFSHGKPCEQRGAAAGRAPGQRRDPAEHADPRAGDAVEEAKKSGR